MPIPLAQLETWSNPGATVLSRDAYARIQQALAGPSSALARTPVRIFLQGSYRNSTNTRGDSDIDVVVLHEGTYHADISALPPLHQAAHHAGFVRAAYQWPDLRRDVLASLQRHFGAGAVDPGNKAIKVRTGVGRMTADVVPAQEHQRQYMSGGSVLSHVGIQFFDKQNNPIANFPEQHIWNGERKNGFNRTGGAYKPTVRLLKNMRTRMIADGVLIDGVAPSYYIESALSNVPDALFVGAYTATVPKILDHLWNVQFVDLTSQNGITPLIGPGPTQWRQENFVAYLDAARNAWDSW